MLQESPGIHCRGITYIPALGIGNSEYVRMLFIKIVNSLFQRLPAFQAIRFKESGIGLISHRQVMRGVNYGLVELKYRIFRFQQVLRDFIKVNIQSNAEE